MESGDYGALVLAAAGLRRLGLAGKISHLFSEEEILPAAGQGILAVQGRHDFDRSLLECVDDPDSRTAAVAERAVIAGFACGCGSPAAAYCRVMGSSVRLSAFYQNSSTGRKVRGSVSGERGDVRQMAGALAERLLKEAGKDG